jgi:hypothetical protein
MYEKKPRPVQFLTPRNLTVSLRPANPIIGTVACCARAGSGHVAAPPSSVMNSRRFAARCLPCFDRKDSTPRHARRLLRCGISVGLMSRRRVRHPVCMIEESHRGAERSPASRAQNGAKSPVSPTMRRDGVRRMNWRPPWVSKPSSFRLISMVS